MNEEGSKVLNAMIVEDEQDLCFLLSLVLIQHNLNPSCANCIADAKKLIDTIDPSVLFLDNRLPDGYGIDFITKVKHDHPATKIVMITAHDSKKDIESALQNGADCFISKPFNSRTISRTIGMLIPGKRI